MFCDIVSKAYTSNLFAAESYKHLTHQHSSQQEPFYFCIIIPHMQNNWYSRFPQLEKRKNIQILSVQINFVNTKESEGTSCKGKEGKKRSF